MLIGLRNENRRRQGITDTLEDDVICLALKVLYMKPLMRIPIELSGCFAYRLHLDEHLKRN